MLMNGDVWIKDNWPLLTKWAKRWHRDEWGELLSQYTIYIHKNWKRFSSIPDGDERLKFSQTWMRNNVEWTNSEFNKTIRTNNLPEVYEMPDVAEEAYLDIGCETDREDIKEFLIDLNKRYSELEVSRIIELRAIYIELPLHEKVLWDLYFNQMLSMRTIGEKLDLPLSAVYQMIKELKIKVREKCNGI